MIRKLVTGLAALALISTAAWAASVYLDQATTPAGRDVSITSGPAANATANGGSVFLGSADGGATSGNGGAMALFAGAGVGAGQGGAVTLGSGDGGATSGQGGQLSIIAGSANADGVGGALHINAGLGGGGASNQNGGELIITAGDAGTVGVGGGAELNAGSGGSTSGNGGNVAIAGGSGVSSTSTGGKIILESGATTGSGTGGDIELTTGASSGGGLRGKIKTTGSLVDSTFDYQTPATGFSITLSNDVWHFILNPAGTLATGTITMPSAPVNGQIVNVRSSQIVTALTVSPNSGQSILGAPSAFAVGGIFECIYRATGTTWFC